MSVWNALKSCFGGRKQRLFIGQFAIFFLLCGGVASLWFSLRAKIVDQDVYKLEPQNVRVWNPPAWVPRDLVREALDNLPPEIKTDELNALDPRLVDAVVRAFSDCPWVEKVESAIASYPARIDLIVEFRKPVAFVDASSQGFKELLELLEQRFPDDEFVKTLAFENSLDAPTRETRNVDEQLVDAFGRELKTDYFDERPVAKLQFPTIMTYGPRREYIPQAAQFAEFLVTTGAVKQYKISQIHTLKTLGAKEPIFFLSTRAGQIVKWGDYSRPRDDVGGATYDGERFDKNSQEERDAVKACQAKKLERWAKEDGGVSLDLSDD